MAKRTGIAGLGPIPVPTSANEWITAGIVVGGLYFLIGKPLLENMGILKSQKEKNVEKEISSPTSPFSPTFWREGGAGTLIINIDVAKQMAKDIWNSVGWTYDDFEKAFSVFKSLSTQSQVSYLADVFQQQYKKDLLSWMLGGNAWDWPADRFSSDQVNQVITYVKRMPKFKK